MVQFCLKLNYPLHNWHSETLNKCRLLRLARTAGEGLQVKKLDQLFQVFPSYLENNHYNVL